jgi:propionate CoA-transferase
MAQADASGNVNVSKFGRRVAGCGGFINISQTARTVVFCGTFTAGGLHVTVGAGRLRIDHEGAHRKFVRAVEHVTFSGRYAAEQAQRVLYVTERAVFALRDGQLTLTEIAPGIHLDTQVLALMDFRPLIADDLTMMESRIFREQLMGLAR